MSTQQELVDWVILVRQTCRKKYESLQSAEEKRAFIARGASFTGMLTPSAFYSFIMSKGTPDVKHFIQFWSG